MTNSDLQSIASTLAGAPATEVTQAASGGNSRVYKVTAGGKHYALKQYPLAENDARDRLNTERIALELMHKNGVHSVPTWIGAQAPYALLEWINGSIILAPKESDIDEAAVFLGTLHHISTHTDAASVPLASEACLSGQIIVDQLEKRVASLMPYTKEEPRLMQFLSRTFLPLFAKRLMEAKKYEGFAQELPQAERTLIAADFGFHNIMRDANGQLYFIDFEYFGWDDPVKLMCDFLLHPATPLAANLRNAFYNHMISIYGEPAASRFAAYYPLFGLRWALILLNEFIPERWQVRLSAKGDLDWDTVKTEQLAKAEAMLKHSETFA